jgi:hypothetical protein
LLARKLLAPWPDASGRAAAWQALQQYGQEPHEREVDRVRLAILRLTEARPEDFAMLVAAAKRDYRDVLMWADDRHPPQELTASERELLRAWMKK